MNKKILIGSCISVVILILVSFTSVIGYRSIEPDVKVSPLFNIRSSKAIGKESKDITTDYLGHGEEANIHLSSRIRRAEQVQKVINIISKMDDKAFSKFGARIISYLKNQEQWTDKETSEALQALQYIRRNPNDMKYYDPKNDPNLTLEYITCYGFPFCIILSIMLIIELTSLVITGKITSLLSCFPPFPPSYGCCYLL
ncbi:MAG: hypothetical protein JSW06_03190 [Thermoplasmatales archaeon]|nr:MAG: hypothetical protein JSW06_03190 [Thermoplasmatales archaeon]